MLYTHRRPASRVPAAPRERTAELKSWCEDKKRDFYPERVRVVRPGEAVERARMNLQLFAEKSEKPLQSGKNDGMIVADRQFGRKAGKHMAEWGLDPSNAQDRAKFIALSRDIQEHPDEIRRVPWARDPSTGKRDGLVTAYIKGADVVLVSDDSHYITTMKGGANNERVKQGKKE